MFNNQIYGLTKGQYSPTSEVGKITKSSPFGSLDTPVQPGVGRARRGGDVRGPHPRHGPQGHDGGVPARARARGRAFVEIYQNCNVFNDGAFEGITAKEARADMLIELEHGEPIRFGADNERGVVLNEFGECEIVDVADVGEDALLVHDEHRDDPSARVRAVAPRRRTPTMPTPCGVFRDVARPTYEAGGAAAARRARRSVRAPATSPRSSAPAPPGNVELVGPTRRRRRGCGTPCRCAAWARRTSSSPACARRRPPRRGWWRR